MNPKSVPLYNVETTVANTMRSEEDGNDLQESYNLIYGIHMQMNDG